MSVTAFGTLLVLAAVAFFALTGSRSGADILFSAGGTLLGTVVASLLTRPRRRGRLVAAVVLLILAISCIAVVLAIPGGLLAFVGRRAIWAGPVSGFVGGTAGACLMRLFDAQASRRRA